MLVSGLFMTQLGGGFPARTTFSAGQVKVTIEEVKYSK